MAALPSERGGSGGRVIERSASTSLPENGGNFGEGTSEASVKKSVLRQWLDGLRGLPAGRSGRAA